MAIVWTGHGWSALLVWQASPLLAWQSALSELTTICSHNGIMVIITCLVSTTTIAILAIQYVPNRPNGHHQTCRSH